MEKILYFGDNNKNNKNNVKKLKNIQSNMDRIGVYRARILTSKSHLDSCYYEYKMMVETCQPLSKKEDCLLRATIHWNSCIDNYQKSYQEKS